MSRKRAILSTELTENIDENAKKDEENVKKVKNTVIFLTKTHLVFSDEFGNGSRTELTPENQKLRPGDVFYSE